MAELQVGIRADVRDGRRVVKTLKDIRRAAGESNATLNAAAKAATNASGGYKIAAGSAGKLAGATDLTVAANAALTTTLNTAATAATRESTAVKAAAASQTQAATATSANAAATSRGTIASRAMAAAQSALATATNAASAAKSRAVTVTNSLTASVSVLRTRLAGLFAGPTAGAKRFITQMRTAAGSVAGLSTAAAGLGAVFAVGIGVGIKNAVQFEKTLSRITGLVGIAKSEVEAFEQPILDIGLATAKGPNELADALFFITSAGFRGADAISVLEASAKAAAAGLGDTKTVADAVTSAVNAYGIENLSAARSTDILVATVREGKAEADSIAGALGQVLPAASELGVEFEELGGTIAALTRIGLGADQGATALGATLAAIQKPGDQAKKTLLEFGTSASQLRAKVDKEGLLVALQDLQERFGDNEEALTKVFPNIRALRAILPLVGKNAGDVADIFAGVAAETDATQKAFDAFTETSAFTMEQAMVAINQALQKMGEDLIPAAAKALVGLAKGITFVVEATENAGGFWAEFFGESDDQYKQAQDRLDDINKGIALYESRTSALGKLGLEIGGIDFGEVELSGSYDENLQKLYEARDTWSEIVRLNKLEQEGLKKSEDLIEEIVVTAKKRTTDPIELAPLDEEKLEKGKGALAELRAETAFLQMDLKNLQTLGSEGIGIAEDATVAATIFDQLQGHVSITEEEIRDLLMTKRNLAEAINDINEEFTKQEAATEFLKDLRMNTRDLAEQFGIIRAGGSPIQIDTLQQARQIFADLGADSGETVESIQAALLQQEAWNAALEAMDPSPVADVKTLIETLRDQRAIADTAEDVERLDMALDALGQRAIEDVASKYGVSADDIDFTPVADKLKQAEEDLRAAWKLSRVIDPDLDPEFDQVLKKIQDKITGVSDIMQTFAENTARTLQDTFSEFLFDPFESDLGDMAKNFADTIRKMVSDLIAQELLLSFFRSLSNAGGGWGALGQAAVGALSGQRADGGPVRAGESYLVGENGPEIVTPRQNGNVIPNEMLMGGQMPAPQVNVEGPTIVNTIRDDQIVSAFNRGGGGQVILNDMSEKQSAYRNALGIRQ